MRVPPRTPPGASALGEEDGHDHVHTAPPAALVGGNDEKTKFFVRHHRGRRRRSRPPPHRPHPHLHLRARIDLKGHCQARRPKIQLCENNQNLVLLRKLQRPTGEGLSEIICLKMENEFL